MKNSLLGLALIGTVSWVAWQQESDTKSIYSDLNRRALGIVEMRPEPQIRSLTITEIRDACNDMLSWFTDYPNGTLWASDSLQFLGDFFSWKETCRYERIPVIIKIIDDLLYQRSYWQSRDWAILVNQLLTDKATTDRLRNRREGLKFIDSVANSGSLVKLVWKLKEKNKVHLIEDSIWKFLETWDFYGLIQGESILSTLSMEYFWRKDILVWSIHIGRWDLLWLYQDINSLKWLWKRYHKNTEERLNRFERFYESNSKALNHLFESKRLHEVTQNDISSLQWYDELCKEMKRWVSATDIAFIFRQMRDPIRTHILKLLLNILR